MTDTKTPPVPRPAPIRLMQWLRAMLIRRRERRQLRRALDTLPERLLRDTGMDELRFRKPADLMPPHRVDAARADDVAPAVRRIAHGGAGAHRPRRTPDMSRQRAA